VKLGAGDNWVKVLKVNGSSLVGPMVKSANGGAPGKIIVFLHGYGADGNDLIGLSSHFAQVLPDVAFLSPNAPEPCDINPMGRQWFSLQTISADELDLDAVLAHFGLNDEDLLLIGFSQGTMMSLEVSMRRQKAMAGVVGFSGALAGPNRLADEITAKPPVLLIHGSSDPVVPFAAMAQAEAALKAEGVTVSTLARAGLQHGIDQEGLMAAITFAVEKLSR
jgi:phospholipase/carboxylesterase